MSSEILVIGDIHQKLNLLKNVLPDWPGKVTFLGDYFDDFNDNLYEVTNTAFWLRDNIDNPNYTFLYGNHDFQYMVPKGSLYCSGFATWKYEAIEKIITKHIWDKINFFLDINDIWFSHAGVTSFWFSHPIHGITVEHIKNTIQDARNSIHSDPLKLGCLWAADRLRGGRYSKGGILWNDWRNSEYIPNIMQVMGHTPHDKVQYKHKNNSSLINIDTHLNQVIILNTDTKEYQIVET